MHATGIDSNILHVQIITWHKPTVTQINGCGMIINAPSTAEQWKQAC
jgi:hypothetical protein